MALEDIYTRIKNCKRCDLYKTRTNPVPGEGGVDARIMFIGEAPGREEDKQGRPFVGAAGKLLTTLLRSGGLERNEVYITNVVKCRPPGNRNPLAHEIRKCTPYLDEQIKVIQPGVICPLGNFATSYVLQKYGFYRAPISRLHGKVFEIADLKILPLYHPAALIYNKRLKKSMTEDLAVLKSA